MNQESTPVRSETETLLAYLDRLRRDVVATMDGLDDEQVRRPGVPSGTHLIGIVHHLTGIEEHWFDRVFAGGDDVDRDAAFTPPAGRTAAQVAERYLATCARSDEIVRASHPEALSARPNPGEDGLDALRSVLVHMVEETGRHAGQADILRELIDGATHD